MRVLDSRNVQVREDLTIEGEIGSRRVKRGGVYQFGEDNDHKVRAYDFALKAGALTGKSVAWIGGGLFVGPRLFAIYGCKQVVFELEPSLSEFCPEDITFVGGDWRDSFYGTYDVIVYDLGDETPKELLERHLTENGVILD